MRYTIHGRAALLWLSVAALPFTAIAQYEMGLANSNYSGVRGVLLNPAAGADGKFKWDLNGLSAGVRFDNTFLYVPKGAVPAFGFKSLIEGIIHTDRYATNYDAARPDKLYQFTLSADILGPSF